MRVPEARGTTFINAGNSSVNSLRMLGTRITAVNRAAEVGDLIVDLQGDRLLPGLINAHDHLQLNTLPPLESHPPYAHAHEWIRDVDARRRSDAAFEQRVSRPRNDRLLIGGLKNLLSGVTTVAHHDPLYPFLLGAGFPIRVATNVGWSHSLYLDGDDAVRESSLSTPPDHPWIIHAAEGTDAAAAGEFDRLAELGCLRPNTLIVHGVALDEERRRRLQRASAGLIWCPSSNLRLFGRTASVQWLARQARVALGTDSRLSGARDLLEELNVARECGELNELELESMVTRHAAALLRLPDRGALRAGLLADLVVIPAGMPLARASRTDIRLVVVGGSPRYADEAYARSQPQAGTWTRMRVDGQPRVLESSVACALADAAVSEPGLCATAVTWRAA